ncbi:hypothetical protein AURDEDRAFT_114203 [Auricularia subglabra TFB-10046 SS5]|nr:hypothetical protein AURDEDRAFT_114203 [Auricularia subglabra TFB-10046 SS5]
MYRAATALALVVSYYVLKRALRSYLLHKYTGVTDIPALGRARVGGKIAGAAVVCGGSIGGLLTARVLSDHFARVVVVEPEAWALTPEASSPGGTSAGTRTVRSDSGEYETIAHKRARVYQYTAIHVYQVLLTRLMRALFPAFDERAKERGVLIAPADMNVRFSGWGGRPPYTEYGGRLPEILYCTRRTFESLLRSLVKKSPGGEQVEYLNGTVCDLKLSADARCVDAVVVRGESGALSEVACELVVDCTGNTQAGLKLLTRALPTPLARRLANIREQYDPQMFYSTIEFPIPAGFEEHLAEMRLDYGVPEHLGHPQAVNTDRCAWWLTYVPDPDVDHRGVFIGRSDHGVVIGAGGWGSEMPVTLEQLVEYARSTRGEKPIPQFFFDICELLEPVADQAVAFEARINSCSRVCYENVPDAVPQNFVALGDATMRLNPRFGEGVTKCAVGVATLDGVLRSVARSPRTEPAFSKTFFNRLASRTKDKWDATRFTDYGRDTTTPVQGETLKTGAVNRWYKSKLNRVMERDDAASSALWHHLMFLTPATHLMAPNILAKVLWEAAFPTPVPKLS